MSRALDHVLRTPWAITRDALELVASIAARENRPIEVIERELGRDLKGTESVRIRDGVAVIPVTGPLFRYANLFTQISGATSFELLSLEFETALASPDVGAVVLAIDSPGGQVSGVDELAELIYRARGRKPISAHISGIGASGAYWLASAADEVSVSPAGMVGSIGAVMSITDYSKREEKDGVERIHFVSAVSPRKNPDHRNEQGSAEIQAVVDAIGLTFVQAVARHRGVTAEEVIERYGEGAVFVGAAAVEAGLADRVELLEDVIARLASGQRSSLASARPGVPGARSHQDTEDIMSDEKKAEAEVLTATQVTELHPEAATQLREQGAAEARAAFEGKEAAAASAERARILGIQALHAPGLENLRTELVNDPGVSVEAAAARILTAQGERARARGESYIESRREDEGRPGPAPSNGTDHADRDEKVRSILTAGRARHTA